MRLHRVPTGRNRETLAHPRNPDCRPDRPRRRVPDGTRRIGGADRRTRRRHVVRQRRRRCTVSFNALGGSTYYGILAGHCAGTSTTWYADSSRTVPVGTTAGYSFPGNDYGLVRYTNTALSYPGEINLGGGVVRDITGAAAPRIGQSVCHLGRSSGMHCGMVTGLNVTVNYGGGDIVYGLLKANVCSEAGDTGGPAFSGTTALGLISGGSGNCTSGGTTFHQPITEVLAAYGLTLY
ncbi:S1 family peptidase [Streptomyces sp. INA 01156]